MEIHQLRYFVALAKTGHFRRAAELCHVTQPSLSQQIKKLEEELNEELLVRRRNKSSTVLTEAGALFLVHARRILEEVAAASLAMESLDGHTRGRVTLGVIPTVAPYWVTDLCLGFRHTHARVCLDLREERSQPLLGQVRAFEMDVAVVSGPILGGLMVQSLYEEEVLLCLPGDHPLAEEAVIPLSRLEREPLLLLPEEDSLAKQVTRAFLRHNVEPKVVFRGAQLETIKALVRARVGLSFIPKMAVNAEDSPSLVYRRLAPSFTREIVAVRSRGRSMSPAGSALWEFLMERFARGKIDKR